MSPSKSMISGRGKGQGARFSMRGWVSSTEAGGVGYWLEQTEVRDQERVPGSQGVGYKSCHRSGQDPAGPGMVKTFPQAQTGSCPLLCEMLAFYLLVLTILMKNVPGCRNPTFQHHKGYKEGVQPSWR